MVGKGREGGRGRKERKGEGREGRRGGRGKEGKGGRLRHGFWGMDAPGLLCRRCTLFAMYRPYCRVHKIAIK